MARSMAPAFAATRAALGPVDSPIVARASARAPAVICSIWDDEADSVRRSTALKGLTSALSAPSVRDTSASKRTSSIEASAASVAVWGSTSTGRPAMNGGTAAR